MIHLIEAREVVLALIDLGGWVVGLILGLSVIAGAVVLVKLWQYHAAGVGRHDGLVAALAASDAGAPARASALAEAAHSHLGPVLAQALLAPDARERLYTLADARMAALERGLKFLDAVAQIAPLLGLFGTVLGMIDSFRAMQAAGQNVDPSVLAGGIWVALMTTAAGLALAMPTSAVLSWFEARLDAERRMAATVIEAALRPGLGERDRRQAAAMGVAHA